MSAIADILRRLSTPLAPEPTGVEPRLPRLDGVRVVLFDVYGTLLVSGSGDISLTSGAARGGAATEALSAVGVDLGAHAGRAVVDALHEAIQQSHAESSAAFPEVDIVRVWQATADRLTGGKLDLPADAAQQLATEYECRVNPVWPMPGLAETLVAIKSAGLPMGIVSNAQFFTPVALAGFLDPSASAATLAGAGFDERLFAWSYAERQAKPGPFLYEKVASELAGRGVQPSGALYVGNDMRNDIWPASRVGFRTALFAGDARSLRWRRDDPRVAGVAPDAVVTELPQLLSILSLAAG
ncbi:MAG: HAD family hydrolase [Planctomycetota bacterium]